MVHLGWKNRGRRWLCKVLAALLVVAQLAATVGFPLPPLLPDKDRNQAYPCQDHPCGCRSAEECWRDCCCYSPQERLAWARAHGIEPPAYAAKPSSGGWQTARLRDREAGECSCCDSKATCCSEKSLSCCPTPKRGQRWQLGLSAAHCKGFNTFWVGGGAVVSPPPPVTWSFAWTPGDWLTYKDESPPICPFLPPVPPPRSFDA